MTNEKPLAIALQNLINVVKKSLLGCPLQSNVTLTLGALEAAKVLEEHIAKEELVWNRDLNEAPKDGTELIFWLSSDKGFEDQTANFVYVSIPNVPSIKARFPNSSGWYWVNSEDILKRPDLVKGWMVYPQPPVKKDS
jgi:hypothetical protein